MCVNKHACGDCIYFGDCKDDPKDCSYSESYIFGYMKAVAELYDLLLQYGMPEEELQRVLRQSGLSKEEAKEYHTPMDEEVPDGFETSD